jgi:ABC-type long-subunit fatty acid transport system fused permease/ATPase subunit
MSFDDISDMGSKWENDSIQIGDVTHNFKSVQPKIILTPLVMVSSFWEEEFIVIFSFIKISPSLHNSIWLKQLKFGQNNLENTGVCCSYNCFMENNFDKSVSCLFLSWRIPLFWNVFPWTGSLESLLFHIKQICQNCFP